MTRRKHVAAVVALSALVLLCFHPPRARAQGTYQWSMVAQAPVDECFEGNANNGLSSTEISANNASFATAYGSVPYGLTASQIANCTSAGYLPKINQAYVWGETEDANGNIWFSTVANTFCLVLDNYYGTTPNPMEDSDFVCDAKENQEEDYKPPRMYMYNPGTNVLTDLTPRVLAVGGAGLAVLEYTFGLRSAGNYNGVVFFGGIYTNTAASPTESDVVMFAFNAQTGAYLGYHVFSKASGTWYNDIRQWHVVNGNLFAGVGTKDSSGNVLGALIRWTGSAADPFEFVDVGDTVGELAYFTAHSDGHIYATTWGSGGKTYGMQLYMSPLLNPTTGLNTTDASNWTPVWNLYADQAPGSVPGYEVEDTALQVGGAIMSFDGYLYFGTMQVPLTSALYFEQTYPSTTLSASTVMLDTNRPIAIFRTQGFDPTAQPTPSVQLLYGSANLEQYNSGTDSFSAVANGMGQTPLYGSAGFGNVFNNYTWSMAIFQNQLYVGTMDWSYLAGTIMAPTLGYTIPSALQSLAANFYGADLWMFADSSSAATAVNVSGMGNDTSYGIRNMVADSKNLWLGMANPMNLRSDMSNDPGGWKLIDFPTQNGAPIITWYNPAPIVYGTPLSATQLNATATVSGVFTYSPALGAVLPAGTNELLSLTFAPYNSGNQYSDSVKINVTQEPLTATANSVTMVYGATPPLPFTGTLTGVVNNDGITASYAVTPAPTSTTAAGTYSIVPALNDPKSKLANYSPTLTNGTLTINKAGTSTVLLMSAPSVLTQNGLTLSGQAVSSTTGTPTGTMTFLMDGSTVLYAAALTNGSLQTTLTTIPVGQHTITAMYSGDSNFQPSSSQSSTLAVQDFQFNVSSGNGTSATVLPGGVATYTFQIAPTYGSYFPNNVTLALTGLPTGDTATITPSTILAGSGPTTVTITVQTAQTVSQNGGAGSGMSLAVLFLPIVGLLALRRRMRAAGLLAMLVLGVAMMLGTNGCGSNTGIFTQAPANSTLTLTGTCGNLQHTVTLTLTVQ